jgi:hypothetical protein
VQGQITPQGEEPAEDRTTMGVSSGTQRAEGAMAHPHPGADRQWDAIGWTDGRRRRMFMVVGLIALAVLVGVTAFRGQSEDPSGVPDRPRSVRSGALTLSPLEGWGETTSIPRLEGLDFHKPVVLRERTSGTRLVAGLLPATSRMLLPTEFVRQLRVPPARPETVKVGPGVDAYYFAGLTLAKGGGLVDVYVLPTTAGIVTVACLSDQGLAAPHYDCWRNAATLQVRGGRALRLGPDTAFRQRLPGAVAALDDAREQARAGLATQVPAQQAAAAARLGGAFKEQAAALAPLAPASKGWSRGLVGELAGAGRAYRGVASALRDADAGAFRRGEHAAHRREHRIKQLLDPPADD